MRKIKFQTGEYYHIFNRGVDKRNVFIDEKDYIRFLKSIIGFNGVKPIGSLYEQDFKKKQRNKLSFQLETEFTDSKKMVSFICYCLNPNHYHYLLGQISDRGIEKFMHRLDLGYTKYFNNRNNRSGSLFEGRFQAVHIKTEGNLLRLSAYINGNPEIHKICKAENWPWSSYKDYLSRKEKMICKKGIILNQFENIEEYKELTKTIIKESKEEKDEIKEYLLE